MEKDSREKLKEQVRKDYEQGNSIIPGSVEEAKKISEVTEELKEDGLIDGIKEADSGD